MNTYKNLQPQKTVKGASESCLQRLFLILKSGTVLFGEKQQRLVVGEGDLPL